MSDETKHEPNAAANDDAIGHGSDAADVLAADHEQTERSFEELEQELAEVRDHLLRAAADAENVRKRAEKETRDARTYAVTAFARDMLSVADNFSRALASLTPETRESMGEGGQTLLSGVELIEKELHSVLARHGVTPIEAEPGTKLDAHVHEAVAQAPSEHEAGTIAQSVQQGWRIGDRTLRAAMVLVSTGPASPPAPTEETHADGAPGATIDTKV